MRKSTERIQSRYNLRHRPITYKKNDYVWKRNFVLSDASKNFNAKLAPKFVGPYQIKTVISRWTYELKDKDGKSLGTYHVKDLKPDHTITQPIPHSNSDSDSDNSSDSDNQSLLVRRRKRRKT